MTAEAKKMYEDVTEIEKKLELLKASINACDDHEKEKELIDKEYLFHNRWYELTNQLNGLFKKRIHLN